MKIIRIYAVWCSSCLIMKLRVGEIIRDGYELEIEEIDYEDADDLLAELGVSSDILPIYIRKDNGKFSIGEKSKKEFISFLEEDA